MCGINGLFDFKRKYNMEKSWEIVHRMNEHIIYRGPNHEGIYQHENVTMGMRRLSIVDLNSGNQPVFNEDKSIAVVFNGEIYNFQQLRVELQECGHYFYTNTDTEVIVHAYEEYGIGFLDKIDGMFAFSLYDQSKEELLIARDRMGEKPLYYYVDDNRFLWASELKSIIGTGIVPKEISKQGLNQYLQLTYIPAPLSIYNNVYKVLPGHYLCVSQEGTVKDGEYWSLRNIKKNTDITYEEAQQRLKELIKSSVRDRMVCDVSYGAFLSGGIDSGTIVGIMSELAESPVDTFTMGFQEKEYDERKRAKKVAQMHKTNHHEYVLDFGQVLEKLDLILEKMDEPFSDPSLLPTYFVSEFASEHVKVVLTGDAGDELFLGYNKYLINYYSTMYKKFPKWMRFLFKSIVLKLPDKSALTRKMRKVLNCAEKDIFTQRKELMTCGFKEYECSLLLKNQFYDKNSMDFVLHKYEELKNSTEWSKTQYLDLNIVLEGDMLTKVDRASMLHSLETRTPLLSRDIIEFAFSLPDDYKIKGKKLKSIMKDAFSDLLPKGFVNMPKSGFEIPLDYWFRNQMQSEIEELLNEETICEQGIFDESYVRQILEEHYSGRKNRKSEIWTLFVFQKWYMKEFANKGNESCVR
ncbi:MAG: asparagine synthase (glutamine-hydrolyzing) [Lachnospiraceae bacterium]